MKSVLILYFLFLLNGATWARVSDFMVQPVPKRLDTKEELVLLDNQSQFWNERQDTIARNIYFLELASVQPFEHPIKALIRITDEQQYEKYKLAMHAHIAYRLAEEYRRYADLYYKRNIYFFNDEFLKEYLDGYDIAEFYYKSALTYRRRAVDQARLARRIPGELNPNRDQSLIDFDERLRKLIDDPFDFEEIYEKQLRDLKKNRAKVEAMLSRQ
ncbi:MAG: hypothetical protein ACRC9L_08860 [Brevinema sp.]